MSFDSRFIALDQLLEGTLSGSVVEQNRNEAQTRFDIIDHVIKEVLGWPHDRISVEVRDDSGYTDYEIRHVGTIAILEAKREGISFTLPEDQPSGVCSIPSLASGSRNSDLRSAMLQVMQYANTRGTAICIVSTGHQWVAFLGSRTDGVPPLEGKALVFSSLAAVHADFTLFHNCLSYEALLSGRILAELSLAAPTPPPALSASISNYPGAQRRNVMQMNLQFLGQTLLEDMPREEQYSELFLTQCYATSGALSSYAQLSKELLTSRNAAMLEELGTVEAPAHLRRGPNPELSGASLAAAASHRPIVLLGGVGVGKSTFIHHLVEVDAKNVFQDAIAIRVDYGSGATFQSPAEYAIEQVDKTLRDTHAIDVDDAKFVDDLYRRELNRFENGVAGALRTDAPREYAVKRVEFLDALVSNRSGHLRRAIDRIAKSRRRQVVIFLDNVDQRGHEDQNQVFLTANEIAASWNATVFVTLRPETYYASRRYGAVSGYHPRVFSIAPPRCDVMLRKRIQFALSILRSGSDARTSSGIGIESESLELFLQVLDHNLRHNRSFTTILDNLSGGNMRRALEFVTQFIGSGHVDTAKIIGIEKRDPGEYFIPRHEFLRSLLHGDGEYYDPQTSPIANLYAIDRPAGRVHFLAPLALHFVRSTGVAKDSSGYVHLPEVYQHLQNFGFTTDAIDFCLRRLGRHKLVEAPLDDFDPSRSERVRITTIGDYTLTVLPALFTYNDAMVVDTPIVDAEFRARIRDVRTLGDRIARVHIFRTYLDSCWSESNIRSNGWDWSVVSRSLESDTKTVASKAALEYARLIAEVDRSN